MTPLSSSLTRCREDSFMQSEPLLLAGLFNKALDNFDRMRLRSPKDQIARGPEIIQFLIELETWEVCKQLGRGLLANNLHDMGSRGSRRDSNRPMQIRRFDA